MTSPKIQKELTNACSVEVTKVILEDLGDKVFTLMVDESRDVSIKEQMGVVVRYVNKFGHVIERFLAMVHVNDTSALSLKNYIHQLFAKHKFSILRLRGQGYDGASNMRGEYNGLNALILKENSAASTMKAGLQEFRDNGWDIFFKEVNLFFDPLSWGNIL
ncbi:unnamed protein product [Cuscuta europaea]|uniref:DUF4371 domain-containing protein n=1 Tax=Cuscuta europaea TaxID=41803 RepID=A0A9P0ZZ48_CUSEU|nr:unnamed protein product [Cuscuta europaea]